MNDFRGQLKTFRFNDSSLSKLLSHSNAITGDCLMYDKATFKHYFFIKLCLHEDYRSCLSTLFLLS